MILGGARRTGCLLVLASLAASAPASVPTRAIAARGPGRPHLAALAAAPGKTAGSGTAKPTRPAPSKPTRDRPGSVWLPSGHPMPDTVLALVDDARIVSAQDFRHGWAQLLPPARPDSLTPESGRQFLDLLIDKELLAARASREAWTWTPLESAQVANLRDRTVMRVALDSALASLAAARAARGEPAIGTDALGVAARESTIARLAVTYDEGLLVRLAAAWAAIPAPSSDSSLWVRLRAMGRMPDVDPADSMRVVAWSEAGTLRAADLLEGWKKLNPLVRPRVETPDQVRDLVKNGLFERVLRRNARQAHYEDHPAVVRAVRRQEEFLASQYFVAREVFGGIPTDDATLRRYYDRDPAAWQIPARLQVIRMLLPGRGEAARMAVRLRDAAEADSLVARGLKERVDYRAEITAAGDSVLFSAAMKSGTGSVLGPDSVAGGWQVVRVLALLPAQARTFDEVRELVLRAWSDQEGERRMQEMLAGLRKRARVVVNEAALAACVREMRSALRPMRTPAAGP